MGNLLMIVSGIPQAAAPMTGVYHSARENTGIRVLFKLEKRKQRIKKEQVYL